MRDHWVTRLRIRWSSCCSDRICALTSGFFSSAIFSACESGASFRQVSQPMKGLSEISKPSMTPVGRVSTWPTMCWPSALALAISAMVSRQSSGRLSRCSTVMVIGRPLSLAITAQRGHFLLGIVEIGDHLQPALAHLADSLGDLHQFLLTPRAGSGCNRRRRCGG